tara:strand:+ start:69 stop:467 length:399 start_codon:yes stop_codon:yes gene_type:complete
MPTKKKRVGFIPREDVMQIIDKLSIENNLSNSKIINILVEEALSKRGIFNKKNGKAIKSQAEINENSPLISIDSNNFIDNAKHSNDNKLGNNFNPSKSTYLNEVNQDTFDLQTYKRFLSFLKFQEMMEKYKN